MHFVLYVTGSGVDVFSYRAWRRHKAQHLAWEQVPDFISQLSDSSRISLVLDLLEEDLQVDFMPAMFPWEKQSLKQRMVQKMQQKGVFLQHSLWSGIKATNEDGRKEEMLLTASVSSSKPVKALVEQIQHSNGVLQAIYSAPFLLKDLLFGQVKSVLKFKQSDLKKPLMLIARMSERTYRQCFFYQGQLRLTRVIELEPGLVITDAEKVIEFLAQEAKLASRFIYNQKILPQGTAFSYLLLDEAKVTDGLDCQAIFAQAGAFAFQSKTQDDRFHTLSLSDLTASENLYANQLVANIARQGHFRRFYTTPYINKVTAYRQVGVLFNLLTLATIALIGFFVVKVWLSTLNEDIQSVQYQLQHYQLQQSKLIEKRRDQYSLEDMDALIGFAERKQASQQHPAYHRMMQGVAEAFAPYPTIYLQRMQWQSLEPLNDKRYTLTLNGMIYPFEGRYQHVIDLMAALEDSLAKQPGFSRVTLVQKPFNIDDSQGFSVRPLSEIRSLPFVVEVAYDAEAMKQEVKND